MVCGRGGGGGGGCCGGNGPVPTGPVGGFGITNGVGLAGTGCLVPAGCRYSTEAYNSMIGRAAVAQTNPSVRYLGCVRYWENMNTDVYPTDLYTT